jgi:hypothetical protein
MATAAAMAALRATVLGDCGGGSSDEDGCRDSGGKDDGDGGNGVGEDRPCRPRHRPLCHPPRCCQRHRPCCRRRCRICQCATKRAMARAAREMGTATKRAMVRAARAMATATR